MKIAVALVVLLASVGAAVAVAAPTTPSPQALALRVSDFPAGAKSSGISDVAGPGGKVYAAAFNFKAGGREEEVTDQVWVVPKNAKSSVPGLVAGPESTYRSQVGQNSGFKGEKSLDLPRYGDEQTANWADFRNSEGAERARGVLVVRKGDVVWTLTVEDCGVLSPFGCFFGPTPRKMSEAQAVAELKKYAAKQKARLRSG